MKACFSSLSKRLRIDIVSSFSHISRGNRIKIEEADRKEEKEMKKSEEIGNQNTKTKGKINNVAIVKKDSKKDRQKNLAVLRSNNSRKERKLIWLSNASSLKITKTCLSSNLKDFRSIK